MTRSESLGQSKMAKGSTTIYHGDAMNILRTEVPDGSVQLIFCRSSL